MLTPDIVNDHGATILTFPARPELFATSTAAERYLEERGFSVGRRQRPDPRGILLGDVDIQKWRNLNALERGALHGRMTGDGRHGPTVVTIDAEAPDAARRAILRAPVPRKPSRLQETIGVIGDFAAITTIFLACGAGYVLLNPLPEKPRPHAYAAPALMPKIGLRAEALRMRKTGGE